nr:MAG TPA: hypothetical protein [Caudoviricetes sp.]
MCLMSFSISGLRQLVKSFNLKLFRPGFSRS